MGKVLDRMHAHLPLLLRVGHRLTRNAADAEDLAHETMLRAMERSTDVRDPERLRGWLLSVQRTVFLNGRRGLRTRLEVIDGGLSAPEPTGNLAEELHRDELNDELVRALDALPEEWREALWLREVEELSYAEIAEAQACPVGTVRSRLARAREALQRSLTEEVGRVRVQR